MSEVLSESVHEQEDILMPFVFKQVRRHSTHLFQFPGLDVPTIGRSQYATNMFQGYVVTKYRTDSNYPQFIMVVVLTCIQPSIIGGISLWSNRFNAMNDSKRTIKLVYLYENYFKIRGDTSWDTEDAQHFKVLLLPQFSLLPSDPVATYVDLRHQPLSSNSNIVLEDDEETLGVVDARYRPRSIRRTIPRTITDNIVGLSTSITSSVPSTVTVNSRKRGLDISVTYDEKQEDVMEECPVCYTKVNEIMDADNLPEDFSLISGMTCIMNKLFCGHYLCWVCLANLPNSTTSRVSVPRQEWTRDSSIPKCPSCREIIHVEERYDCHQAPNNRKMLRTFRSPMRPPPESTSSNVNVDELLN